MESLDENLCEISPDTRFNLFWTCPNCKEYNAEYDVTDCEELICECEKCHNKYSYYVQLY